MAAVEPDTVDVLYGPQIVGSWLNMMLLTLELMQAYRVLGAQPSIRTKLLVVFVLLVDVIGSAGACAHLYLNCVTFWGNVEASFLRVYWPYPLIIGTGGITGAVVHTFLLGRFWQLCVRTPSAEGHGRRRDLRNLSSGVVLTGAIGAVAVVAFVGAVMTMVSVIRFPYVADDARWVSASRIWQVSSALADIGLAAALAWKLSTLRTSFADTKSLLRRLSIMAIETGATTSALLLLIVILLLFPQYNTVAVAGEICLGRAYANTLLLNLQLRKRTVTVASGPHTSGGASRQLDLTGIQVTRTVLKQADLDPESGAHDLQTLSHPDNIGKAGADVLYPPTVSPRGGLRQSDIGPDAAWVK